MTCLNAVGCCAKSLCEHFIMSLLKAAVLAGALGLSPLGAIAEAAVSANVNVRDFGAHGDGVTKDTVAIQTAIDAVASAGGGTVELSAGTYLTGSIFLKSNVDLHLGAGAVLKGSPDSADYNRADVCPQNYAPPRTGDNTSGGHLVLCIGQHNVGIRGPGKIDGNADAFLLDAKGVRYPAPRAIPWRPGQMVWFVDSADVRIQDVEFANSPYWSCYVLNCTRVGIRGCYVHTERRRYHTFNGDGIDIDRSQHVMISDCRVDTADDCITLRASRGERLAKPQDCAFVTVANCSLSSACSAVRPGVGEGVVRDCVLSNLVISDTRTAFNFVAAYAPTSRGPDICDIRISDVRVAGAERFLKMHHMYSHVALFRNIVFSGISGAVRKSACIYAHPDRPFENIRFERCDVNGGVKVVNADVSFADGSLSEIRLSDEEKAKISQDVAKHKILLW